MRADSSSTIQGSALLPHKDDVLAWGLKASLPTAALAVWHPWCAAALLYEDGVLIGELEAADGAGAVVVQPLADAGRAEAVLAGQLHDAAAALEVVQADLALLLHLLAPRCRLHTAQSSCQLAEWQHPAVPNKAAACCSGRA